jgi:hypothetical protein
VLFLKQRRFVSDRSADRAAFRGAGGAGVPVVPLRGLRRKRHCRGGERRRDSCKDEKSHESLLIE